MQEKELIDLLSEFFRDLMTRSRCSNVRNVRVHLLSLLSFLMPSFLVNLFQLMANKEGFYHSWPASLAEKAPEYIFEEDSVEFHGCFHFLSLSHSTIPEFVIKRKWVLICGWTDEASCIQGSNKDTGLASPKQGERCRSKCSHFY